MSSRARTPGATRVVAVVHVRSAASHANLLTFVCIFMRRISAHFALLLIYCTMLAPFLAAAQQSSLHACCLRAGAHHCQSDSHEAGAHSAGNVCPHAMPLLISGYVGIQSAKFRFNSPALSGFVTKFTSQLQMPALVRNSAARAPPGAVL